MRRRYLLPYYSYVYGCLGPRKAAQAALDAREAAEHLESERESMMQLLKQKTESIRSLQVCVWRVHLYISCVF